MTFRFACGDLEPGCESTFEADTKDDLWQRATDHCRRDHGLTDFGPDVYDAFNQRVHVDAA